MIDNLAEVFEKLDDEILKFSEIENKRSNRPDLHAFLLLDSLLPGTTDMIDAAEHDEFYLSVDVEELAKVATEEHIRELMCCGVRYSEDYDCLFMFA
jgi:hypothetical protein